MIAQGEVSDDESIGKILAGELDFYEVLRDRYHKRLFQLVYPIVGDRSETEDVIQETHLRALTHLNQFAGRSKFATWLGRIAIYEALGRLRRRRRFESTEDTPESAWIVTRSRWSSDPEEQAIETQLGDVLRTTVNGLPQAYRSVVTMRLIDDMSTFETCQRLKLTEEAVKTRLHRAKSMLRRQLAGRLG
jgi:RNA polymerase sigma-70 factor (ECF subfamily)